MNYLYWTLSLPLLALACKTTFDESQIKDGTAGTGHPPLIIPDRPALTETEIAKVALLLGLADAPEGTSRPNGQCSQCHGQIATTTTIQAWGDPVWKTYNCLNAPVNNKADADKVITCLKTIGDTAPNAPITAARLGILAATLPHPYFETAFNLAGKQDDYAELLRREKMPRGADLTQGDMELIYAWFFQGTPNFENYLRHDGPKTCGTAEETFIGKNVKAHIAAQNSSGQTWAKRNEASHLPMFACHNAHTLQCFTQKLPNGRDVFPVRYNLLDHGMVGMVRELHTLDKQPDFWVRSSADGRFFSGGGSPSFILDLEPRLNGQATRFIEVDAAYDPGFLPDNRGFIFQGAATGSGTGFCRQSILNDPEVKRIDFKHPDCNFANRINVGLYQGIGSNLANGHIATIAGDFSGDDGFTRPYAMPPIFMRESTARLQLFDGESLAQINDVNIQSPFWGSWNISPTNRLLLSITSGVDDRGRPRHGGFNISLVPEASRLAKDLKINDIGKDDQARICTGGGEKGSFSLSERYLVYYQYSLPDEVENAGLDGSADIYIVDLLGDLKPKRITKMGKGQFAQFPHFRSDGWLYFLMRDFNTNSTHVMATDALVRLRQ